MQVFEHSSSYTVVLDKGEEILESLTLFAQERGIDAASVQGIGALDKVEVGYFDHAARVYERHELPGEYELLSFLGNITLKNNAPFLHAHVVLSAADLTCLGGHLFAGRVSVTAELHVVPLLGSLHRAHDPDTGLYLL